jgi:hypothetical protein
VADDLRLVRLLHPGREHDRATGTAWNQGAHRRRFMEQHGRYVRDGVAVDTALRFWGEWEPGAEILPFTPDPEPQAPRHLFQPVLRTYPERPQNTDPFVFGGFYYGWCRQSLKRHTLLQRLARGSIILFGSSLGGGFVLDTVFVVASFVEYFPSDIRTMPASDIYRTTTLIPAHDPPGQDASQVVSEGPHPLRLYTGATHAGPLLNGTFSFFPCLPAAQCSAGFPRPPVRFDPSSTTAEPNQKQGYRHRDLADLGEARRAWDEVVSQIAKKSLLMGVAADQPGPGRP